MGETRIFHSSDFFQPAEGEPIRSIVTESAQAIVVAWYVKPGQTVLPHLHPGGQDTWTILQGQGDYYLDQAGTTRLIGPGDVVVAPIGCVHGVVNRGEVPLLFISVVSPATAGYEQVWVEEGEKAG